MCYVHLTHLILLHVSIIPHTKVGKWGKVHLSFIREYSSISESAAAYLKARIILKGDCVKCITFPWPWFFLMVYPTHLGTNSIVPTQCTVCGWILRQAKLEANSQAIRHIRARCWPWDSRMNLRSCVVTLAWVQTCKIQGTLDYNTTPW